MIQSLLPGTHVRARGLRWEVVLTDAFGPQTLVRLRALEGGLRGREVDLLHPLDHIEPIVLDFRPTAAAPLRNWIVYHRAFLLEQALGPDALLAVQPGRLRIEPYQLVPVLRALRAGRVRLLLADGVGLGKTIQAGLILTELMARRIAHRILIVSPAGPLLDQWRTEMRERFGLRLDVADRARLEEIRRATELGANPFDAMPLALASIDFLKQERVLDQLERSSYDVVVIDEAHHCTDLGTAGDREDSQRRRLASVLARRSDALLLLTATPHDGNDRSFASLCELLDPSLVDGRGSLRGDSYRAFVVRRLKHHVRDAKTGQPRFRERTVIPRPVTPEPRRFGAFLDLQRGLLEMLAPELRRAFRARRYSDVLSFISLLKRSVSTVAACRATLDAVASRFEGLLREGAENQDDRRQRLKTLREFRRKLERFGTATAEEEAEAHDLETEDIAQQLVDMERELRAGTRSIGRLASVVDALSELQSLAEQALPDDPKVAQLIAEIRGIRSGEPRANVLVYTEYTDSQDAVAAGLRALGAEFGEILTLSGDDNEARRTQVTERFRSQEGLVLVSTDTAAEGLNLHQRCHHLIHLELPFNPNRLEQRNGRIDRYGQTLDPIVRYLFLRGSFEERILLRLIAKYERQRARLTFVPNTLGLTASTDAAASRLLKGLMDEDTRAFRGDGEALFDFTQDEPNDGTDQATLELLEEIDRSLQGFEQAARTYAWLGEAGLNAEERLVQEADRARERGEGAGATDLADFVADAASLDGGALAGSTRDTVFTLTLPSAWCFGLDDIPGFDAATRSIRLTTQIDVTRDAQDRAVGFLGRAHPLVRRALDRVRHLSFGASGAAAASLDVRVSAVQGDGPDPILVGTYLARVMSAAGRELERVVAVVTRRGEDPQPIAATEEWLAMAEPSRALRTSGVWDRWFADWAPAAVQGQMRDVAGAAFAADAAAFADELTRRIEEERRELASWLASRAEQVTGGALAGASSQPDIFAPTQAPGGAATWRDRSDPAERLAGFASDTTQLPSARGEADGVLRIYAQRMDTLRRRADLRPAEVLPLGLLMVVPSR